MAADIHRDDRRRVVNVEAQRGRKHAIIEARGVADIGTTNVATTVIAVRGERLALVRSRFSSRDKRPEAFYTASLIVVEIDHDELIAEHIMFDPDDIDGALAEIDARYLADEAAPHAHTWSLIAKAYAAFNRGELSATTPEWSDVDHRRGAAFAPGEMTAYLQAAWDDSPDTKIYIAAVHRLSNLGVVVTHIAQGISQEGFGAEWRDVHMLTVEGEVFSGSELFNEADLDAALARFDELDRAVMRLDTAATRAGARLRAAFAARDWDTLAEILADDLHNEDRRRVVNAGIRHGRDSLLTDMRAAADIGVPAFASVEIATRGERLVLVRAETRYDDRPGAFHVDNLAVAEFDAEGRMSAQIVFDLDDLDGALAELDARYIAGEAAACARTWSALAEAYAAINRRETPATSPHMVSIDHRRGAAFADGDLFEFLGAAWVDTPDIRIYVETIFRLTNSGAVVNSVMRGTTQEGFDAEWREVCVLMVEGDLPCHAEVFQESDLDAALTRFDELDRPVPRLQNTASQVGERFRAHLAACDWQAIADISAADFSSEDRRRIVGAGLRHGSDSLLAEVRTITDLGPSKMESTVLATRGGRLDLELIRFWGGNQSPDKFEIEFLFVLELNADDQMKSHVAFDLDDIDAAFAELDARYLAGEAAAHAHTWSVITEAYASIRRHELPPAMSGCMNIDHRGAAAFAPGELVAWIRAGLEIDQTFGPHVEVVHRLTNRGAVITYAAQGTSPDGFDAEWREISLSIVAGDMIIRCELFDEADLDAALARFDELSRPEPRRLENAASGLAACFEANFTARDWDALADLFAQDYYCDDRRRVVNGGVRRGRAAALEDVQVGADVGLFTNITSTVIATRGERLMLQRVSGREDPQVVQVEFLLVVEGDAANRIAAAVVFDHDDVDAAFAELDARYVAGEAATHAQMWSLIARSFAALNRRETPATTPDYVIVDHQLHNESRGLTEYLHASWDLTPDLRMYIEAVDRLSDIGAVITLMLHGTSEAGFDAEWRIVEVLTAEGDAGKRCEVFDEADIDAALARFDELSRPAP
jgi:hypothetical protein